MKLKQCALKILFYAMCMEKDFSPLKSLAEEGGRNVTLPFRMVLSVGRVLESSKNAEYWHGKNLWILKNLTLATPS